MPTGVEASPAAVERQQLAQGVVVGDVGRPAVGGRDGGIKGRVRVGEPLRAVVVPFPSHVQSRSDQSSWNRLCRNAEGHVVVTRDDDQLMIRADARVEPVNNRCLATVGVAWNAESGGS